MGSQVPLNPGQRACVIYTASICWGHITVDTLGVHCVGVARRKPLAGDLGLNPPQALGGGSRRLLLAMESLLRRLLCSSTLVQV